MKHAFIDVDTGVRILTQSLRAIRKKRGMTAGAAAAALGMPLRTYQEFESGRGPMTHERLFAFAEATDSDPFALILGAIFGHADLAVDCADTKFCMIMMMYFEEFAAERGGLSRCGAQRRHRDLGTRGAAMLHLGQCRRGSARGRRCPGQGRGIYGRKGLVRGLRACFAVPIGVRERPNPREIRRDS